MGKLLVFIVTILGSLLGALCMANAAMAAERTRMDRPALAAKAGKLGLATLFDSSVLMTVRASRLSEKATQNLSNIAIETGWCDREMIAIQVYDDGAALFLSSDSTGDVDPLCGGPSLVGLVVTGYKGEIFKGTSLPSLRVRFWRVLEIREVTGHAEPVFVIQSAW